VYGPAGNDDSIANSRDLFGNYRDVVDVEAIFQLSTELLSGAWFERREVFYTPGVVEETAHSSPLENQHFDPVFLSMIAAATPAGPAPTTPTVLIINAP
jgi:hypothetical protein